MASQRLFVATLAGDAAAATANLFLSWRAASPAFDTLAVDRFCTSLRDNGTSLPIVYFCEWIDRWLMGDQVPGPGAIEGRRFQTACFSRQEAIDWASRCGSQYQEQEWLATRLREAALAWSGLADRVVVVVVREVFDGSTMDEEVQASLAVVPRWLSSGSPPNQAQRLTAAATMVSRGMKVLQPARAVSLVDYEAAVGSRLREHFSFSFRQLVVWS